VVYDPEILVAHHPAPRVAGDDRADARPAIIAELSYNEALSILEYFSPFRRVVFMVWALLVGTGGAPGLAVVFRDLAAGRPSAWSRFAGAQRGRLRAWRTHRSNRRMVLSAGQSRST
jgi:hypothetical protein